MNTTEKLTVIKGKPYRLTDNNLWTAWAPVMEHNPNDYHGPIYKGPKIHHIEWMRLLAWMYNTNKRLGVECQCRLYAEKNVSTGNTSPQIVAVPFPQEYSKSSPMTTKEVANGQLYDGLSRKYRPKDYIYIGSVHTHCNSSAFQSGTDHNDEKDDKGLHITLGHMNNTKRFDIHTRLSYLGDSFHPVMESWYYHPAIEKLDGLGMTNNEVNEIILMLMTTHPGNKVGYPAEWDDVMIEKAPMVYTSNSGAFRGMNNGTHSHMPKWAGHNNNKPIQRVTNNKAQPKNGQVQYDFHDLTGEFPDVDHVSWEERDRVYDGEVIDLSEYSREELVALISEYLVELVATLMYSKIPGEIDTAVLIDVFNEFVVEATNNTKDKDIHTIGKAVSEDHRLHTDVVLERLEVAIERATEMTEELINKEKTGKA